MTPSRAVCYGSRGEMRVEVWFRDAIGDARAVRVLAALRAAGVPDLHAVRIRDVYLVAGVPGLRPRHLVELVCDPVAQQASVRAARAGTSPPWDLLLEVAARPGVADPVATSLRGALRTILGLPVPDAALVQTARQYLLQSSTLQSSTLQSSTLRGGGLRGGGLHAVPEAAFGGLFNPLIQAALTIGAQQWRDGRRPPRIYPAAGGAALLQAAAAPRAARFPVAAMSDSQLTALSEERLLALSLAEMQAIRDHYRAPATRQRRQRAGLGDAATDVELEMLAQTWSEHCKHKIFNAAIEYRDGCRVEVIDSLFDTCIRATTRAVDRGDGFLRSVFHDNSGVIEFDADTLLCFKVETHNSPSALDPYGGAITGIVGVNRDIIGTGRGARPIFNTNVLCFAPPDLADVPAGLLPPRQVRDGVHRGIVDGGNQSGIPTVAGAVLFDASFVGKPLVFCGTGGILPAQLDGAPSWEAEPCAGDRAVMVGGRIGRDGIHGATFSSLALDESSPRSAVQIGDPITQKKMADFLLEARDLGLYRAITDNGAGGLSSSFGEMAAACGGVRLELERAPLKYQGLEPWEILVSESQERMSLAVPPEHYHALAELAARREVEIADLGAFTADGTVELRYAGELVGLLDLRFLHHGLPRMELRAVWQPPAPPAVAPERTPAAAAGIAAAPAGGPQHRLQGSPGAPVRPRGAGPDRRQAVRRPADGRPGRRRRVAPARRLAARDHRHARHLSLVFGARRLPHGDVRGGRGGARPRRVRRRPGPHGGAGQLLLARPGRRPRQPGRRVPARPTGARRARAPGGVPGVPAAADLGQGLDEEQRRRRWAADRGAAYPAGVGAGHHGRPAPLAEHRLQAARRPDLPGRRRPRRARRHRVRPPAGRRRCCAADH